MTKLRLEGAATHWMDFFGTSFREQCDHALAVEVRRRKEEGGGVELT